LFRSLRVLYMDMILVEKITNVHRLNRPDRLSDRENAWAAQLPAFDAVAQCESIVQHGGNVEHGGEAPTVEHRVQLWIKLLYAGVVYAKKSGREDVDVTVPEACGNDKSFTVDDGR
jgi:hypothetical protein